MLSLLASALILVGLGLSLLGGLAFLIAAFRSSILWGLGVLFIAPLSIAFLILHWSEAKNSFFLQLWGCAFILLATIFMGGELPIDFN